MGRLARIRQLEADLSAEIVIQEEEGHDIKEVEMPTGIYVQTALAWYDIKETTTHVIDKNRLTKPDEIKRQQARQELQEIYDNSKWYNFLVRRAIRKALYR